VTTLCSSLLALTLVAVPEVHWSPVAPPADTQFKSWALDGETLLVVGADGTFHRWEDGVWTFVTGPPPGGAEMTSRTAVAPDGAIWTAAGGRALLHRFDGERWSDPISLPPGYVHTIDFEPGGAPWIAGIHGYVVRVGDDGWEFPPDLPLDKSVESNIYSLRFDGQGTLWMSNGEGVLIRRDAQGAVRLPPNQTNRYGVVLDADGRPLLTGDGLRRIDEDGWPVLVDRPVRGAQQVGDDWYLISEGKVLWTDLQSFEEVELPTVHEPTGMTVTRGGDLFAIDAGRNVYVLRPGRVPALRDVATEWGVATLTDAGTTQAADFDGDGLDDLAVVADDGSLRLLLQREGTFLDATADWGLELLPILGLFAVCDLDGNGRPDIVARESLETGDDKDVRLRYLRTLGRRFVDHSHTLPSTFPAPVTEGKGLFTCADVDADGDTDLLVTGDGVTLSPGPRVALYENAGFGHLVPSPLSSTGLGQAVGWVVKIVVEDLDVDGLLDFAVLNSWGDGHVLLRGVPGRGLQDVTEGSGLDSLYGTMLQGWATRIDDDPYPELVIIDRKDGPRIWKGSPDLVLNDVTQKWGLVGDAPWRGDGYAWGTLADVDGDGHLDLATSSSRVGPGLLLGSGGPFVDRTDALPAGLETPQRIVDLDLGGDGDRDLLMLFKGDDRLLENRSDVPAGAAVREDAYRSNGLLRRLSWAKAFPDGLLAAVLMLVWALGCAATRMRGGDLALGRPLIGAALTVAAVAAYAWLLESSLWPRLALLAGSAAIAASWSLIEVAEVRRRSAIHLGGFRLGDILGKGGFGKVYRARHTRSGALAAVKMIDRDRLANDRDRKRFHDEAASCAAIGDDRVVRIFGKGEFTPYGEEDLAPIAYLVMELLTGVTLGQFLAERDGRRLEVGEACAIGVEVCLALKAVDDAGIVHRDIKPDNVMLVRPGRVKVMDFGVARTPDDDGEIEVVGTVGYMAPEQLQGVVEPTHATDLYALGTVLYEMLAGSRPFVGTEDEVVDGILYGTPPPLSDHGVVVDGELEALIGEALAKAPEDRPASGLEMATRLSRWATSVPVITAGAAASATLTGAQVPAGLPTVGRTGVLWRLVRSWATWAHSSDDSSYHDFLLSLVFDETQDPQAGDELSTRLLDGLADYKGSRTVALATGARPDAPAATRAPEQLKGPPPLPTALRPAGLRHSEDEEDDS